MIIGGDEASKLSQENGSSRVPLEAALNWESTRLINVSNQKVKLEEGARIETKKRKSGYANKTETYGIVRLTKS